MPHPTPLNAEVRRRVQRALRTRSFRQALRSNTGAIDLASIMVGVIVIGVIAGVIAATVFAVIPWSQNAAAKQNLDAVRTAESVTNVQNGKFLDMAGLVSTSQIQASPKVSVGTDAAGTCYMAVSKSAAGTIYYSTNTGPDVKELTAATTSTCLDATSLTALISSVGGLPASAAAPVVNIAVSAGAQHSLAVDTAGNIWAWGSQAWGGLGDGVGGYTNVTAPKKVTTGTVYTTVAAGNGHSLALDAAGNVWGWGDNSYVAVGVASGLTRTPQQVLTGNFKKIAAGNGHSLALDSAGNLWSWGNDYWGQLGNGAPTGNRSPAQLVVPGVTFTQISAGESHDLAIDSNGNVWGWGRNTDSQIGASSNNTIPQQITTGTVFTSVAGSRLYSLALDSTGQLWTWGSYLSAELGNGLVASDPGYGNVLVPTRITTGRNFVSIAAGGSGGYALDAAGAVWAWGYDSQGQVGNGAPFANTPAPTQIAAGKTFTHLAGGNNYALASDASGKIWGWGGNGDGQIGNGATADLSAPVQLNW